MKTKVGRKRTWTTEQRSLVRQLHRTKDAAGKRRSLSQVAIESGIPKSTCRNIIHGPK